MGVDRGVCGLYRDSSLTVVSALVYLNNTGSPDNLWSTQYNADAD